jgi:sucrose-6-phosphate hydrolase SacC (GH32 family)
MTVPCELTLRTTRAGVRLFANPVKELETLRGKGESSSDVLLTPKRGHRAKLQAELLDVRAEFGKSSAEAFGLTVRGLAITYDVKKRALVCKGREVPVPPGDDKVRLRVLVDRGSVEVFAQDGAAALVVPHAAAAGDRSVEAFARGGEARLGRLEVHALKSAWEEH